jgi:predicted ester cyclase
MSAEANKAVLHRITEEVFNKGNFAIIPELIAPEYVYHTSPEYKGPEGFKKYVAMERKAFPDLHLRLDNIVAEGDMVAFFYTYTGTFKGERMGIAPTGKKLSMRFAVLSRFADGKEAEAWPYIDSLTFYKQLGVAIPQK